MLLVWGSICDGQSHLGPLLDVVFNSVFEHLSKSEIFVTGIDAWLLKSLTLMSMGEKYIMKNSLGEEK